MAADNSTDYGALLGKLEARAEMAEKKLPVDEIGWGLAGKLRLAQLTKSYVTELTHLSSNTFSNVFFNWGLLRFMLGVINSFSLCSALHVHAPVGSDLRHCLSMLRSAASAGSSA